jgi:hypothetical protein
LVAKLDALTDEQRKPTARSPGQTEERARLRTVLDQGHTDLAAAQILTAEFGPSDLRVFHYEPAPSSVPSGGWAPQKTAPSRARWWASQSCSLTRVATTPDRRSGWKPPDEEPASSRTLAAARLSS